MKQNKPLPPAILLIGPTGSGKTPLGDALEDLNFHHFDFGEQLRLANQNPVDFPYLKPADFEIIDNALHSGSLLTDDQFYIAAGIFNSFIDSRKAENGTFIMNGLPRHPGQAEDVAELVKITGVINLLCDAETVRARIQQNSGGDRFERIDDSSQDINNKLSIFKSRTAPLIEYYQRQGANIFNIEITPMTTPNDIIIQLNLGKQDE